MCGIVGYAGARPALGIVLDGLRRLEYRGYDSAGVAIVCDDQLLTEKKAGKLANLEKVLSERAADDPASCAASPIGIGDGTTGIGHTRWATHGGPTDRNAHPHVAPDGRVAVIHNGIIENFAKLRAELEADGVQFTSDTDTECAAHLLAAALADLRAAGQTGQPATARRRHARGLPAAGGRVHPARRGRRRARCGGRRPAQLAAGRRSRRRGELPGQRRGRVHRAHPGSGRAGPGPDRADHRRQHRDHRLRRPARRRQGLPHRLGLLGRREGRLRLVHAQGDRGAAAGHRRHAARPAHRDRRDRPRRGPPQRPGPARRRQDLHRRLRHGVPRRHGRQVRHRALDPDPVRGGAGQRVPLPRPGARPVHADRGRSRSPARRWTP